jgi:FkbM family methyltransferase
MSAPRETPTDAAAPEQMRGLLAPVVHDLFDELGAADAGPDLEDNIDFTRFPDGVPELSPAGAMQRLVYMLSHVAGMQLLHDRLEEPADQELLARVLAYRILGPRRVQLPMTSTRLRELLDTARSARVAESTGAFGIYDWRTDDFDLTSLGWPLTVRTLDLGIVQTFLVEQYRCPGALDIAARPGDVVIDGGACLGDTSLYFAQLAGEDGRVVAVEFEPGNLELLSQNLALNPALAERVSVHRTALWDAAGERLAFRSFGPASALVADGEETTTTETIDGLVARGDVDRVDFIKLDIEGAELQALRGARETLTRFRPRLAIAAYHKPDDLVLLPAFVDSLGAGYRFRLGHTTMHTEETVLFARAD